MISNFVEWIQKEYGEAVVDEFYAQNVSIKSTESLV